MAWGMAVVGWSARPNKSKDESRQDPNLGTSFSWHHHTKGHQFSLSRTAHWYILPRLDLMTKEFFRTCNVLPFSCTHLALWREVHKRPKVHAKQKVSRISLMWTAIAKLATKTHLQHLRSIAILGIRTFWSRIKFCLYM